MSVYTDRMDNLVLRIKSPDGKVTARWSNIADFDLSFADGCYERYDEDSLGQQIAALLGLIIIGWDKAHIKAMSEELGRPVIDEYDGVELDGDFRKFRNACRELEVVGASANERIYVSTVGCERWTVFIRMGTLARLGEAKFIDELKSAVKSTFGIYSYRVSEIAQRLNDKGGDSMTDNRVNGKGERR